MQARNACEGVPLLRMAWPRVMLASIPSILLSVKAHLESKLALSPLLKPIQFLSPSPITSLLSVYFGSRECSSSQNFFDTNKT